MILTPQISTLFPYTTLFRSDEAVKFISEGDKIFLDASTTAWYMAKALPDVPLTVVTNSIKVTLELAAKTNRSEEHTSELQSRGHLVCRLLLEKKKKNKIKHMTL